MGQITEDFARRMMINAQQGKHSPLTYWEEIQLAWAWLKLNGFPIPGMVSIGREALREDYPAVGRRKRSGQGKSPQTS